MCRPGKRCPGQQTQAAKDARNARRREAYAKGVPVSQLEQVQEQEQRHYVAPDPATMQVGIEGQVEMQEYRMQHQAPMKDEDDFCQPLHDLTAIFPKDVYEHPDWYSLQYDETKRQLLAARDNPDALVTIYRGVPKGVTTFHPGDWVALSYEYAQGESLTTDEGSTEGQVIKMVVPSRLIYTNADSLEEWGLSSAESYEGELVQ